MPNPVKPSRIRGIIPTVTGLLCERLEKVFQFAQLFWEDQSYKFTEGGTVTTQHGADICAALRAIGCAGGGTGGGGGTTNPNMPAPTGVNATDGTYSDKIRVSWNTVTPPTGVAAVTKYKVYRSLATNTDPNSAVLISEVNAPTTLLDDLVDADLASGSTYNYWVRATNGTQESAFSSYDVGSATAPTPDVPAISDLRATQGFSPVDGGPIGLVWTPPAGATKYDVYRSETNDFSTATKIQSDMAPQNTADHTISNQTPDQMWDNVGEILLWHFPPLNLVHYFFWVVAKKDSPPGYSPESNSANGWVRSFYAPYLDPTGVVKLDDGNPSATEGTDFLGTQIRVVLFGGGGGGAGGSQIYGGGGGGGGSVMIEEFTISAGDVLSVELTELTSNAPATTSGEDGSDTVFKINGVTKMTSKAGLGGVFSGSGGGAGGIGGTGSTGTSSPTIYDGKPGLPGVGAAGGRSGYSFGNKRYPGAHFNGYSGGGFGSDGAASIGGGGSFSAPGVEVLAVGGYGHGGYAVIVASGT